MLRNMNLKCMLSFEKKNKLGPNLTLKIVNHSNFFFWKFCCVRTLTYAIKILFAVVPYEFLNRGANI